MVLRFAKPKPRLELIYQEVFLQATVPRRRQDSPEREVRSATINDYLKITIDESPSRIIKILVQKKTQQFGDVAVATTVRVAVVMAAVVVAVTWALQTLLLT